MKNLFKTSRPFTAAIVLGLLAFCGVAHAMGIDVQAVLHQHAGIVAGLSMVGFLGEVASVEDIQKALEKISAQVKEEGEKGLKEVRVYGAMTEETKKKVDEVLTDQADMKARLAAAEQLLVKVEKGGGAGKDAPESMSSSVMKADGFDDFRVRAAGGMKGSFSVPVKAAITSIPGSAGAFIEPTRVGLIAPATQRLFLRDLLSWGRTGSNSIEYIRETGFTNNANVVSENPAAVKPQSDLTFEADNAPIATIAHWIRATKQVLADVPMLQSYIDGRLIYGLKLKEEAQLLKGSGTGLNINGILNQATPYANPGVVVQNETAIDRLRIALLQVELAEYAADGIVLNPIDWTTIELTKNTQNQYLFTQPQGIAVPTLWGRPVVATQSMDMGDFLVGAFQQGAQGWDREDVNIVVSTEDRDNLVKNMVTVLCEERVGLTVYRPESFVAGDFDDLPVS